VAEAISKCHCCVSQCISSKQRLLYLSFHGFPSDLVEKKKWVVAIHRDEVPNFRIQLGCTFKCNRCPEHRHFWVEDYQGNISSRWVALLYKELKPSILTNVISQPFKT
uniref:THAP-type domain-containing protein n=1 Tax=Sphaeramia orbicularis TaxID=375764 RepID=A0A672Z4J1_9TELE